MKAVCWYGTEDVRVETVPDPTILNPRDAILKVTATTICGSDLHIGGFVDKLPMGAAMNKALTFRSGQMFGPKYIPKLVEHVLNGDVDPSAVLTHRLPLAEIKQGFEMFKHKQDQCIKVMLQPA
jgi:threonine dehydrogenase-like Zn-dependent dehydrogenase